jgi:hypothetical protein
MTLADLRWDVDGTCQAEVTVSGSKASDQDAALRSLADRLELFAQQIRETLLIKQTND